ncbi:hypothetical protein [Halogeometricum sp. CBA1124]|uniref:hypothetical protein n=1 Tax=Halogeometricum sp. CBA1124 TaxID=2668071 RepID=UPI001E496A32|nr:hypothetical protein [Halogeometricum sp. CBA1124]
MDRFPLACSLVAAVLLVTSPLYVLPHASSPAYRHTVQPVDGGGATATPYADLPARARQTFDAARSADGAVVERTTDPASKSGERSWPRGTAGTSSPRSESRPRRRCVG